MFSIKTISVDCGTCGKDVALHKAILTSTHFSVIATDALGVIQLFNVGAQRMLGYTETEVLNRMCPGDLQDQEERLRRASSLSIELHTPIAIGLESLACKASRGMEDIFETQCICKDGSRLDMVIAITALWDAQGDAVGYLIVGTDNTLRKRTEADLKRAMHAVEAASNAKSDFISRMSHELRTPLNAILGFAQLIDTGHPAPTPTQQKSVDQILKGGWYLLALINEILDLALVESGRLYLSIEPISVNEVMQVCRAMMEPQAKSHAVDMQFAELSPPKFVFGDRVRLKQVMINLLMNAIKYNRSGGSVSVDFSACSNHCLRIHVRLGRYWQLRSRQSPECVCKESAQ